ncbi:hypothetical protein B0A55_12726 [Friedmanniomyces simplex]|uniref:HTH TFE/IIEalpha-type domain-containing protein n=1 Tax=Friedmanniomyces simplex TaxID=329884 RepID=A0A4U0W7W9_9PEZI|nr:hypothetical protein B0A55_12726 [Friedmanniomyces simplex]
MGNLATDLLRTITRAFYTTDHVLVVDALLLHSTLPDTDLCHVLAMQNKAVRKLCGRLKEDGILSTGTRQERRTDGSASFFPASHGASSQQGKERTTNKEWYYLNYHRAIDSIKYRLHKLNQHFSSLGLPATEKKDLSCPQCKAQWTELEVMHNIDFSSGLFLCARCNHPLDPVQEDERANENESLKRLNSQLEKILQLMQQIDSASVPENDFESAIAKHTPVVRTNVNPAQRIETVDIPKGNLQSSKGLAIAPEKIAVSLHSDEDVKREAAESERLRREKEAGQNALPDWIARSTVSGDVTTVGAKEEQKKRERELNGVAGVLKAEEDEEKKPVVGGGNVDLDAYWAELEKTQKREAEERAKDDEDGDEEDDDDDEDDFADVDIPGSGTPAANGVGRTAPLPASTGVSTPALESSNATDDERDAKRPRLEGPSAAASALNGAANPKVVVEEVAEGTPAASDEDEDELEFENV